MVIRNRTKASIGVVFALAAVGGVAGPASAATAGRSALVGAQSREFIGFGGSSHLSAAIHQAETVARGKAAAAHATGCGQPVDSVDDSDPFFFVVEATITCTG